jgi:hypothetical protein
MIDYLDQPLPDLIGGQVSFVAFAAEGQHEARLVLRSPVKEVVNKNRTEPQAAQSRRSH